MGGPWEKYQSSSSETKSGPWTKFQNKDSSSLDENQIPEEGIGMGLLRSTVRNLPALGTMAGGTIGGVAGGPVGGLAGAAAGSFGGEALRGLLSRYIPGEEENVPKSGSDIAMRQLKSIPEGVIQEGTGQLIDKAIPLIGNLSKLAKPVSLSGTALKPNSEEIKLAAQRLGTEATPGMLGKNPALQRLETSLEESPTKAGVSALNKKISLQDTLRQNGQELLKDQTPLTSLQVGDSIKDGITQKVQELYAPLKQGYAALEETAQGLPAEAKDLSKASERLLNNPLNRFEGTQEGSIIRKYADNLTRVKTVDDLRTLEKSARAEQRASNNFQEQAALSKVLNTIDRVRRRQVLRSAMESAPDVKSGKEAASGYINELKKTNKGYRAFMETIEDIAGPGRLSKMKPQQFMDAINDIPSEQIADKLFSPNNYRRMLDIKEHIPEQFELMRKAKITDLANKSATRGDIDPNKLVRNLSNIGKEARALILGDESESILKDLKTVLDARPELAGPSGTPRGLKFSNYLSYKHWLQEFSDAAKAKELDKFGKGLLKPNVTNDMNFLSGAQPGITRAATGLLRP